MEGRKWAKAVVALQTAVGCMGEEDRAMVTFFESSYRDFAEGPLPKRKLLEDPVFLDVVRLGTDGGTELGPALAHVLDVIKSESTNREAAVVLITDAQVANESAIMGIADQRPNVAFHCFGIDLALNDSLLVKLAREHSGTFHSLKPDDDIVGAVSDVAGMLRGPVLTNLAVSEGWEPAEAKLPDLYAGQVRFIAVRNRSGEAKLQLTGRTVDGAEVGYEPTVRSGFTKAAKLLWCKQRLEGLLRQERKAEAIALSKEANLVTPLTAFVAWDEAEKTMDEQDAERRRMTRTFFDGDVNDPVLYDATFNSTTVQMHEISHSVIEMIKNRFNADGTSKTAAGK